MNRPGRSGLEGRLRHLLAKIYARESPRSVVLRRETSLLCDGFWAGNGESASLTQLAFDMLGVMLEFLEGLHGCLALLEFPESAADFAQHIVILGRRRLDRDRVLQGLGRPAPLVTGAVRLRHLVVRQIGLRIQLDRLLSISQGKLWVTLAIVIGAQVD